MAINRETKVTQSVKVYSKIRLEQKGWSASELVFLEAFPYTDAEFDGDIEERSYLAFGFNFDDDGRAAEMGSDLKTRVYTLEFFVFADDEDEAKAIANDLKFAIDTDEIVPIVDLADDDLPQVDSLVVLGVSAKKVLVEDPDPFQEHVWLTTARVEDTYSSSLA